MESIGIHRPPRFAVFAKYCQLRPRECMFRLSRLKYKHPNQRTGLVESSVSVVMLLHFCTRRQRHWPKPSHPQQPVGIIFQQRCGLCIHLFSFNSAVYHQLFILSYTSINSHWYIMGWVTNDPYNTRQIQMFVTTGLCMGLSTVVVGLRLLGRRLVGVKLWWDDCIAVLALVCLTGIPWIDCNSWHAIISYSHTVLMYSS